MRLRIVRRAGSKPEHVVTPYWSWIILTWYLRATANNCPKNCVVTKERAQHLASLTYYIPATCIRRERVQDDEDAPVAPGVKKCFRNANNKWLTEKNEVEHREKQKKKEESAGNVLSRGEALFRINFLHSSSGWLTKIEGGNSVL